MSICIDETKQLFTLHTRSTSYQMKVDKLGFLHHNYYGSRIPDDDMSYLTPSIPLGFSGNPYDAGDDRSISPDTMLQEYPGWNTGDHRITGLMVTALNGVSAADLRFVSAKHSHGASTLTGLPALYGAETDCETLEIVLEDAQIGLRATLLFGVWEDFDIITRSVRLHNFSNEVLTLEKAASLCLELPPGFEEFLHFHGRHAMERQMERLPFGHCRQSLESTRGTSSHQQNPFAVFCEKQTTEDFGNCIGLSLVYSGNFQIQTETDQLEQVRVIAGIHPDNFSWELKPEEDFDTPQAVLCFSDRGFTALSHKFHDVFREHLIRGKFKNAPRPVLINNWEATYFNFDTEKILEIARCASALGVEMLVLDDGWFGKRDSDCSGLGDWSVNTQKLPGGLKPLVEKINAMGMKFGLWFEPEMISEDSELYRTHSDWAIRIPGRDPVRSRFQLVLDLSRPEVRDYLFEQIGKVLDSAPISYVKWDMNRHLCDLWSAALPAHRQGELSHRYVLGLYELLERFHQKYPDILWEGCSGGGGRFDAGMLYYHPQIWCSDDTDAIERIKIQYGTSFGYPVSSFGSHVSAVPNHQTGRSTPFKTRAITAMCGSFGYELDLNQISEAEKALVKEQIQTYKHFQMLIYNGDYYRLTNPFENPWYAAWEYAAKDGSEVLVHAVMLQPRANAPQMRIKLKGLLPSAKYKVAGTDQVYSGSALMNGGLPLEGGGGEWRGVEIYIIRL